MALMNDLKTVDPEVAAAIDAELNRQRNKLELIASENIVSTAVMTAQGSVLTNKYAEGYPGKRFPARVRRAINIHSLPQSHSTKDMSSWQSCS